MLHLAGDESRVWHTHLEDFILVAQKLEGLGFIYNNGSVTVVEPIEEQKHV
jgi:hypothetical protein